MDRPEYVRLKIDDVPDKIITEYESHTLVNEESLLYVEVTKGMYGIHQAKILAQQQLEQRLN